MEKLTAIVFVTFLLNLPFGWLREGVKKFSAKWFAYVHAPIPLIVVMRIFAGISIKFAPILIAVAVAGQSVGARFRRYKR